eukprot:COSAG01_NODE_26274_length_719_cov_0.856452_1_plen_108_part_00
MAQARLPLLEHSDGAQDGVRSQERVRSVHLTHIIQPSPDWGSVNKCGEERVTEGQDQPLEQIAAQHQEDHVCPVVGDGPLALLAQEIPKIHGVPRLAHLHIPRPTQH